MWLDRFARITVSIVYLVFCAGMHLLLPVLAIAPTPISLWRIHPTLGHQSYNPLNSLIKCSPQRRTPGALTPEVQQARLDRQLSSRDASYFLEAPLAELEEEGTTRTPEAILNHLKHPTTAKVRVLLLDRQGHH